MDHIIQTAASTQGHTVAWILLSTPRLLQRTHCRMDPIIHTAAPTKDTLSHGPYYLHRGSYTRTHCRMNSIIHTAAPTQGQTVTLIAFAQNTDCRVA